ncbi:MAG: FAD-dependent 2-octaprenylphenol hydroxylase [Aliiglaciecola sp.]
MQHYDLVIVGAGMIGLTAALALKDSGLSVAVVDSQEYPIPSFDKPELRVSAINLASEQIFENLGAWQGVASRRMQAYQNMHVWEQDSFARIEFNHQDIQRNHLGTIVENEVVRQALLDQVKEQADIDLICPVAITSIAFGQSECFISLSNEQTFTAKLVIGADGANSYVRRVANLPFTFWDYDHIAIVATIETELEHNNTARQAFTQDGPLAFLPLYEPNLCSIVWSQKVEKAEQLLALDESAFNQAINVAIDGKLGVCKLASPRVSYPLKMRYCRQWLANRVMIIGDAAHTIHPLAGQGANLGIADAAALAQTLIEVKNKGKDIGDVKYLRTLERWRKAEAMKMIATMEGFKRLFDGANPVQKLVRGLGVSVTNQIAPLKRDIISQAVGVDGNLPELAKPAYAKVK